jgi:hypothetical protein
MAASKCLTSIVIFTSYFNYFNNTNRSNIFNKFKQHCNCVAAGIEDGTVELDHAYNSNQKLFLKENLLNLTINKHLDNSSYIFWVDADVKFSDANWHSKAIELLNDYDVVQLFTHSHHLDNNNQIIESAPGYIYNQQVNQRHGHTGYAWAMTRQAFKHLGGLYEYNILGAGDAVMAQCFLQKEIPAYAQAKQLEPKQSFFPYSQGHEHTIRKFHNKCKCLKVGYLDNTVYHEYHGAIKRRKYTERYNIYDKHNYDPLTMIEKTDEGIIQIKDKYSFLREDVEAFLEYKDKLD